MATAQSKGEKTIEEKRVGVKDDFTSSAQPLVSDGRRQLEDQHDENVGKRAERIGGQVKTDAFVEVRKDVTSDLDAFHKELQAKQEEDAKQRVDISLKEDDKKAIKTAVKLETMKHIAEDKEELIRLEKEERVRQEKEKQQREDMEEEARRMEQRLNELDRQRKMTKKEDSKHPGCCLLF